jgi:branched-chain amino acid transport system substrate-binding protein
MRRMACTGQRGPLPVAPATRGVIQTVYPRKVEARDDHYGNVEFDKIDNMKDPGT